MKKAGLIAYITVMVSGAALAALFAFYPQKSADVPMAEAAAAPEENRAVFKSGDSRPGQEAAEAVIGEDTEITYEYYYENDGITESVSEEPPGFLLGKNRNELEKILIEWEVVAFSESSAVLRKIMPGDSSQHYILGIYEGYVAAFYAEETDGRFLKEITDRHVDSLAPTEKQRLSAGISITGIENLVRAMEDYGS